MGMTGEKTGRRGIRWLFFDVGGTIFDEEPVYRFHEEIILDLLERNGCGVEERQFQDAAKDARKHYLPRYVNHLIWIFTEDEERYQRISVEFERAVNRTPYPAFRESVQLIPGIKDLLLELRQHYMLGIIGNQPAAVRKRLEEERLTGLFPVQAISAEMGMRKPDLRFFLAALAMAQCQPNESVMVGDRLDNDIYPARALGMTTVRLKIGPHRHQPVLSPEYLPHYTCTSVKSLAKLLTSDELEPQAAGAELMW